jgi:hypothetical protein
MFATSTVALHRPVSDEERLPLHKTLTRDITKGGQNTICLPALLDLEEPPVTPSDFIPGLYALGSTYNVLNGKYADPKSILQEVTNWNTCKYTVDTISGLSVDIQFQPKFASRSLVEKTIASPR